MMDILRIARLMLPACAWLLARVASAQVTPEKRYFGVDRPVPMRVGFPEGVTGEATLVLYDLRKRNDPTHQGIASKPVPGGPIDLAALFPEVWTSQSPRPLAAQLVVEGKRIGPAVHLFPMVQPAQALLLEKQTRQAWFIDPATNQPNFSPRDGQIAWVNEPPTFTGYRAHVDKHALFETSMGEIEFRLRDDAAPNTVANFRDLVEGGFYSDIIFHRVVNALPSGAGFAIQVGDPTGTGRGGPGYAIDLEPTILPHDFGVLSMARGDSPDSAGSQVFICLSREGTQSLDGRYTAFAEAVRGADVIEAIAGVKVNGQRPEDPPVLKGVRLIDAPPFGEGVPRVAKPARKPQPR
jgi:peptidyl-prolyl cis-trans isomerase B (cyclophilin B)